MNKRTKKLHSKKVLAWPISSPKRLKAAQATLIAGVFVLIGGFLLAKFSQAAICSRSSTLVPSCGALWGAYVPGYNVTNLESKVGRNFDVFEEYNDWSTGINGQIPNAQDLPFIQGGRILLASWQPRVFSAGTNYSWPQIASGSLDANIIIPQANRVKSLGSTKIFLAFDSEFDDSSTHSQGSYGTPAQFVAAYRHIHDVFATQGVTNVVWVWTPTGYSGNYPALSGFYPGDSYVDWMGYDPYNFYSCGGRTTWNLPSTVFGGYYNWIGGGALGSGAANKPMILDEYGSHDDPTNTNRIGAWYSSLPSTVQALPRLKAVVEFDSVGICDTRVDASTSDPATLSGFTAAGHDPFFNQTAPPSPSVTPAPTQVPPPTIGPKPTVAPSATPVPNSNSTPAPSPTAVLLVPPGTSSGPPPVVSGDINITPPDLPSDAQSIQYLVDGKPVSSGVINTKVLANGTHTVGTKTTLANGIVQVAQTRIIVKNPKPSQLQMVAGIFGRLNIYSILVMLLTGASLTWYLLYRLGILSRVRSRFFLK